MNNIRTLLNWIKNNPYTLLSALFLIWLSVECVISHEINQQIQQYLIDMNRQLENLHNETMINNNMNRMALEVIENNIRIQTEDLRGMGYLS